MNEILDFGNALVDAELLYPSGILGVFGRSGTYNRVADGLHRLVNAWGDEVGAAAIAFPPIVPRATFESTNYVQSFPDLMGSVHVFTGGDRDHAELCRRAAADKEWADVLEPSDLFLASAACHPVYPLCTGTIPESGRYLNVQSYCFRHEPSSDPARMQSFQMHEIVFVGNPEEAERHRDDGLAFGISTLRSLGLDMEVIPANDPFFGRLGTAFAANQLDEVLKLEGTAPIGCHDRRVAIISGNCHREHFGHPFEISLPDGTTAHSACVAFGIDRITLALFWRHGFDLNQWPDEVTRSVLT